MKLSTANAAIPSSSSTSSLANPSNTRAPPLLASPQHSSPLTRMFRSKRSTRTAEDQPVTSCHIDILAPPSTKHAFTHAGSSTDDSSRSTSTSAKSKKKQVTQYHVGDMLRDQVADRFPWWKLGALTISLLGVQLVWTVEMGYGTPYLASLGLSKPALTLAWLAGPFSGLLMQPLVGAWSDQCTTCRLGRRRPFILGGTVCILISLILMVEARSIVSQFGLDTPPIGPSNLVRSATGPYTIGLVVFAFYLLDFAINAVQASCRTLIVDVLPAKQQSLGNSWASAMIGAGNVLGYFVGSLDLMYWFPWVGGSQLRALSGIAGLLLTVCVLITSVTIREKILGRHGRIRRPGDNWKTIWIGPFRQLFQALRTLPLAIRQVCHVQFFAWIGWFPFNLFATEYVKEVLLERDPRYDATDPEAAVRTGSEALLFFSFVSIAGALVLPLVCRFLRLSMVHVWVGGHLLFALCMFMTIFVEDRPSVECLVAIVGICWAITMWVPYSIVGQFIAQKQEETESMATMSKYEVDVDASGELDGFLSDASSDYHTFAEWMSKIHLPEPPSSTDTNTNAHNTLIQDGRTHPLSAGVILGIHNAYIVLPQLVSSCINSIVFAIVGNGPSSIEWVWRVGGVSALLAAAMTLKIKYE